MHETGIVRDIISKIVSLAKEQQAEQVLSVSVKLGALSNCSADHFREHFEEEAAGTIAEGVELNIRELADQEDPQAQEIILESIDIAES